jgi:hypothetical protein
MKHMPAPWTQHVVSCLLVLALIGWSASDALAQCAENESEVVVEILTDNYPGEITWTLSDASGVLLSGGPYNQNGTTFTASTCIDGAVEFPCLQFVINDSYGDGICCGYGQGAYTLYLDGVEVATGGSYASQDIVQFDCAPGATCNDALALTEGDYGTVVQPAANFWYAFTPPANISSPHVALGATPRCTSTTTATWATSTTPTKGPSTLTTTRLDAERRLL